MNSLSFSQFWRQFVIMIYGVSFNFHISWAQRLVVYPCTDLEAIRWVRDKTFCEQYYICHFGQPFAMPSCPSGQVWSNSALNCVPRESRWNDCIDKSEIRNNDQAISLDVTILQPTDAVPSEAYPTSNNIVTINEQFPKMLSQSKDKSRVFIYDSKKMDSLHDSDTPNNNEYLLESATESEIHSVTNNFLKTSHNNLDNTIINNKNRRTEKQHRNWFEYKVDQSSRPRLVNSSLHWLKTNLDHPCTRNTGALLPHPENCHWYFNCSMANNIEAADIHMERMHSFNDATSSNDRHGLLLLQPFRVSQADLFVWECHYPQLFDEVSGKCREFVNVNCKSRFEPVDRCEYSANECSGERCSPCDQRFARCRGRQDGVYPLHEGRWTPVFVTCYRERNIAQDECVPPIPIFSPEQLDCVSLLDVPKEHGGFLPDCTTRQDGYYPDEQGRCAIFFRCALGRFRGYDECPPGSVFDPVTLSCQPYSTAARPCGEGHTPRCADRVDGLYADPYGRCTNYFQCQHGIFQQYFTCDLGIFDPLTQRCVISAELTVRPCGLQPSPCEELPTGMYPDQATGCNHFIECHHGNMITNGTCNRGEVFSSITGQCDRPEDAPPPCGVSPICIGQPDGRYPALNRGCSFFYECYHEEFLGIRRCTESDGGVFFNPDTGTCDYPQNICPPCGSRWWGCSRTHSFNNGRR